MLAKAVLTHFTVFQFEVFPTVISGPASLNFKRLKQKQETQHVPEQGRNNNHSVFFSPTFYSTHFLPYVSLSFSSLNLSLYRLWATWALASSPWPLMWRLPSAVFSSPPRATG